MRSSPPTFFSTPARFRAWLRQHHSRETELWVGYFKKGTGKPSITWPESVDEALCFGWIDGIRKSVDADAYTIRFTPRKTKSIWSDVNTRRATALIESGEMQPAGLRAFNAREAARAGIYAYERVESAVFSPAESKSFRANAAAWRGWESMPPSYRRVATHWVISAKRAETRALRLATLIADSAAGLRIGPMRR